jgi:threonine/homoserine/homoserine lactone efflux protein
MDRSLELAAGYSAVFQSPLTAFVLTSLIIEMTPGPNMAYLAVLGASRSRIAGFSAVLGVALGLALLGVAVGLGGGSLVLNNRLAYESLRWAARCTFAGWPTTAGKKVGSRSRQHPSASLFSCSSAADLSPTC